MSVSRLDPEGIPAPPPGLYHQVAVATGTRTVHVAGQIARTADGTPVAAGDLAGQVERALRNVGVALSAAGASFGDVVRLGVYVVDWHVEKMGEFTAGWERAAVDLDLGGAPITMLGVAALAEPDLLVEIEATAVL